MAKDPYKYFRTEARELLDGLGQGVLQLEKGATPDVVARLLRLAHTLKGAARVVKQPTIAEDAHAIEDALEPLRDLASAVPRERIDHVLRLLDAIGVRLGELDAPVDGAAPAVPRAPVDESFLTVRADIAEMDALLDSIAETSVQLRAMRRAMGVLERARHLAELLVDQTAPSLSRDLPRGGISSRVRSLAEELRSLVTGLEATLPSSVDQVEREMRQVRDAAEGLRLLPASSAFASLERTTRDAAHSLGKQAAFEAKGGDVRLDAHVLGVVQAALVQMVRNAVAHGIESEAARTKAGKAPRGRVELEVLRRGNRIAFICRDDGAGIDLEAVRRVAKARGLAPSEVNDLGAEGLVGLLLEGGLTTSVAVTEVSGRGVGLDVVRAAAARLGGQVTVATEPGRGTTIELVVPVSLSSVDALLVQAGGVVAAIPLDAVRRTLRLDVADVVRAGGTSVVHEGEMIPFVPLSRPLRAAALPAPALRMSSAVVVEGANARVALGVDRLLGTARVVMVPLPSMAASEPLVAGLSLDAEGNPQLVLDPEQLVLAALGATTEAAQREPTALAPVLVIDDSLTTRMLEQSILESAGYRVELATSAEEGLEKARRKRYGLFLVDVEMPGMDGFEFVALTRADPVLREIPAILVTSRDSPDDRRRGSDAGARAYIVKGEFDQGLLLDTIGKLLR
ncbi:MAG TPA: response regulator [Polyangiaceae bacterium]